MAEGLFRSLNNSVPPGQDIFLDVPEINSEAVSLAQKHQMVKCFETARMYSKDPPNINLTGVYGVTTLETG